ncbi:integrase catalytic region, partial [Trifolium medium]|nr:integrase catalytic region [Trifolium medium]
MPPRVAPVIPQPDTDSVLYIHPSEGPNSINVVPKLIGQNYLAWSRSMKCALGAKNKLPFIDGSMEVPALDDLNRSQWERGNYLVYSWILNSVSDPIASTIAFHDNAIDVWLDLQERFSKADRVRIATLRNSINNLKQVIQFLTGLNDQFSVVKTQVLLMDPLPPLNKVYSLVVQEENNHPPVAIVEDSTSLINAAQRSLNRGKSAYNGGGKNNSKYCTFCHRNNHVVEFCYAKHGYPNQVKNSATVNASTHEGGDHSNGNTAVDNSQSTNPVITQEQYSNLMALLQQLNLPTAASTSNPSPSTNQVSTSLAHGYSPNEPSAGSISTFTCSLHVNSSFWLLDSGASDHDVKSKRMIGLGNHVEGLYKLQLDDSFLTVQANNLYVSPSINTTESSHQLIPTSALWHFRLGHVSNSRLSHMIK